MCSETSYFKLHSFSCNFWEREREGEKERERAKKWLLQNCLGKFSSWLNRDVNFFIQSLSLLNEGERKKEASFSKRGTKCSRRQKQTKKPTSEWNIIRNIRDKSMWLQDRKWSELIWLHVSWSTVCQAVCMLSPKKQTVNACMCHFEPAEVMVCDLFQMWVYQLCSCQLEQAMSSTHELTSTSTQQVRWLRICEVAHWCVILGLPLILFDLSLCLSPSLYVCLHVHLSLSLYFQLLL